MKVPPNRSSNKTHSGKRVDIAWAFVWGAGAVLFAAVAAGSYLFAAADRPAGGLYANAPLPPIAGDVTTTGTVAADGETVEFAVYPSSGGLVAQQSTSRMRLEIETLRKEIAGLRRNVSVLEHQNDALSRRLAAIEGSEHVADPHAGRQEAAPSETPPDAEIPAQPEPHVETLPAPELQDNSDEHRDTEVDTSAAGVDPGVPVRIIALPRADDPATVGSIPDQDVLAASESGKDAKPVISVAPPAGKTAGETLSRTDFAADLGLYPSKEAARKTLSAIKDHLALLEGAIEPRVRPASSGGGTKNGEVRLLLGPFANAADAAAACVLLSAREVSCRPNIYAGNPLHDE